MSDKKWRIVKVETASGAGTCAIAPHYIIENADSEAVRASAQASATFDEIREGAQADCDRRNAEAAAKQPAGFVLADAPAICEEGPRLRRFLCWHSIYGFDSRQDFDLPEGWHWLAFDASERPAALEADAWKARAVELGTQREDLEAKAERLEKERDHLQSEVTRLANQLNELSNTCPWEAYMRVVDVLLQVNRQREEATQELETTKQERDLWRDTAERNSHAGDALAVELQATKAERDSLREVIVNAPAPKVAEAAPPAPSSPVQWERDDGHGFHWTNGSGNQICVVAEYETITFTTFEYARHAGLAHLRPVGWKTPETKEECEARYEAWRLSKGVVGEHDTATVFFAFMAGAGFQP